MNLIVLTQFISISTGEQLRICDRGQTCCTTDMEHKLSTHSRAEFDRLLRDTVGQIRTTFAAQAQKFDGK